MNSSTLSTSADSLSREQQRLADEHDDGGVMIEPTQRTAIGVSKKKPHRPCIFCGQLKSDITAHLITVYKNEDQLIEIQTMDKRARLATRLWNIGIDKIMVLANTWYAYLVRRDLWKHRCQLKPTVHEDEPKQKRKRNVQSCKLLWLTACTARQSNVSARNLIKNMKLAYSMYSKATACKLARGLGKTLKDTTLSYLSRSAWTLTRAPLMQTIACWRSWSTTSTRPKQDGGWASCCIWASEGK